MSLEATIKGVANVVQGAEFVAREDGHPGSGKQPMGNVSVVARRAQYAMSLGSVVSKGGRFTVTHDEALVLLKDGLVDLAEAAPVEEVAVAAEVAVKKPKKVRKVHR